MHTHAFAAEARPSTSASIGNRGRARNMVRRPRNPRCTGSNGPPLITASNMEPLGADGGTGAAATGAPDGGRWAVTGEAAGGWPAAAGGLEVATGLYATESGNSSRCFAPTSVRRLFHHELTGSVPVVDGGGGVGAAPGCVRGGLGVAAVGGMRGCSPTTVPAPTPAAAEAEPWDGRAARAAAARAIAASSRLATTSSSTARVEVGAAGLPPSSFVWSAIFHGILSVAGRFLRRPL